MEPSPCTPTTVSDSSATVQIGPSAAGIPTTQTGGFGGAMSTGFEVGRLPIPAAHRVPSWPGSVVIPSGGVAAAAVTIVEVLCARVVAIVVEVEPTLADVQAARATTSASSGGSHRMVGSRHRRKADRMNTEGGASSAM